MLLNYWYSGPGRGGRNCAFGPGSYSWWGCSAELAGKTSRRISACALPYARASHPLTAIPPRSAVWSYGSVATTAALDITFQLMIVAPLLDPQRLIIVVPAK